MNEESNMRQTEKKSLVKMNRVLLLIVILILCFVLGCSHSAEKSKQESNSAEAVDNIKDMGKWEWVLVDGGLGDVTNIRSIIRDSKGNFIVVGTYDMLNVGGKTLTTTMEYDSFIGKIGQDGKWLWVSPIKGEQKSSDVVIGGYLVLDSDDNIYVRGFFTGNVQFGDRKFSSSGSGESNFLAKIDSNGNWLWLKEYDWLDKWFNLSTIFCLNDRGNMYTFSNGGIACLSPDGDKVWSIKMTGTGINNNWGSATGIEIDPSGNIYFSGHFDQIAQFGNHKLLATEGAIHGSRPNDIFIGKISPAGKIVWIQKCGGKSLDWCGLDIAVDGGQNVYISGSYTNEIVIGKTVLGTMEEKGYFLAKLDRNGNWLWASSPGRGKISIETFNLLSSGNIGLVGSYEGLAEMGESNMFA